VAVVTVCTGSTVAGWLNRVRRTRSSAPSSRSLTGLAGSVDNQFCVASSTPTTAVLISHSTPDGVAVAVGGSGSSATESEFVSATAPAATGATVPEGVGVTAESDTAVAAGETCRDRRLGGFAGNAVLAEETTARAGLVLYDSTATVGTAARADGRAVATELGARAARSAADLRDAAPRAGVGSGAADAEAESESGLSADATPIACGPARDNPSANAAAPTRTAFLVVFIKFLPLALLSPTTAMCRKPHVRIDDRYPRRDG